MLWSERRTKFGGWVARIGDIRKHYQHKGRGSHLTLTGAELANQELYKSAKYNDYLFDVSSHSRGGLTASNALQDLNNNQGIVGLPINQSRFYGSATNVQDYANQLVTNGSGQAYSSVHQTDFVGRTPWLLGRTKYVVGGNEVTGGVGITPKYFYSHSSYRYEMPPETIFINGYWFIY